jgi:hypothetical protein
MRFICGAFYASFLTNLEDEDSFLIVFEINSFYIPDSFNLLANG